MPHTPDGEDPEKTMVEKLQDKFDHIGDLLSFDDFEDIIDAFAIMDSVQETIDGLAAARTDATIIKAAGKHGMTPIEYTNALAAKAVDVSKAKAMIAFGAAMFGVTLHMRHHDD